MFFDGDFLGLGITNLAICVFQLNAAICDTRRDTGTTMQLFCGQLYHFSCLSRIEKNGWLYLRTRKLKIYKKNLFV